MRVVFELVIGFYYLNSLVEDASEHIAGAFKWGVGISLLALVAASLAQVYSWKMRYLLDQRLKLTQQLIGTVKAMKCMQLEERIGE